MNQWIMQTMQNVMLLIYEHDSYISQRSQNKLALTYAESEAALCQAVFTEYYQNNNSAKQSFMPCSVIVPTNLSFYH